MPVSWLSMADSRRIESVRAGDFTSTRSSLMDAVRPRTHAPVAPRTARTAKDTATPTRSHRRVVHVESPLSRGSPSSPVMLRLLHCGGRLRNGAAHTVEGGRQQLLSWAVLAPNLPGMPDKKFVARTTPQQTATIADRAVDDLARRIVLQLLEDPSQSTADDPTQALTRLHVLAHL